MAPKGAHETQEEPAAAVDDGEAEEEIVPIVRPQNTRTIEIERFVPVDQVDARYFEKAYYILPRGEISQEAFAVIRDAMAREKVAGLARVVLSSRERPFLVEPTGRGLRGLALRFAQDVRPEQEFFEAIPALKLPAEMIKLAQHIIRTRRVKFDPAMLEDHYRTALVRILKKKQSKRTSPPPAAAPSRQNVINLTDALRRSVAAQDAPKKSPGRRAGEKRRAREPARKARGG